MSYFQATEPYPLDPPSLEEVNEWLNLIDKKNAKCCECGCGKKVKEGNRFINGHSNLFKKGHTIWEGKHHSQNTKDKISESKKGKSNPFYGKHHSKKSKERMSESHKGEKNWNWRGGITPFNAHLRGTSKFKIWKELVFLRDNFTCQNPTCDFCNNEIGAMLHPHHIKPVSLFPELAFKIYNGITYCAEFHLKSGLHRGIRKMIDEVNASGQRS